MRPQSHSVSPYVKVCLQWTDGRTSRPRVTPVQHNSPSPEFNSVFAFGGQEDLNGAIGVQLEVLHHQTGLTSGLFMTDVTLGYIHIPLFGALQSGTAKFVNLKISNAVQKFGPHQREQSKASIPYMISMAGLSQDVGYFVCM